MLPFVLLHPERSSEGVDHLRAGPGLLAPLEPDVVVAADPGQGGEFLTPQPGGPPQTLVDWESDLGRGDLCPPGTQETAQLGGWSSGGWVGHGVQDDSPAVRASLVWGGLSNPGTAGTPTRRRPGPGWKRSG